MFSRLVLAAAAMTLALGSASNAEETLVLYGAGSLKTALSDVVAAYEQETGRKVETAFGPSGLMRERIEAGEQAHVFASANMAHPKKLEAAGRAGPVQLFAKNQLCALARPEVEISESDLLDVISGPNVRLGTSTPGSDPSGDYAWELFEKAESVRAGHRKLLEGKALKLTGGPDSEKPPEGRNNYAWVMDTDQADVFLTYCTNAVFARRELPDLQIVGIPPELSVGADYGLTVLKGAPAEAQSLAKFILGPAGQKILAAYGFEPAAGTR